MISAVGQARLLPDDDLSKTPGLALDAIVYDVALPQTDESGADNAAWLMATFYPFRPALQGIFLQRFNEVAREICEEQDPKAISERFAAREFRWATEEIRVNPAQRRIYRAVWLLLRDLLRVRWTCRWQNEQLEIAPPPAHPPVDTREESQAVKATMRAVMAEARRDKLLEARDFIARMEHPSPGARARVPVTTLIADGPALATTLRSIAALPDRNQQLTALRETVRPYLQLVREGDVCQETGHRLSDIWRYFRLTWATPAENTPGRTMLYLIRDEAQPYHPIIGIASLENTPLRITDRDTELGWTLDAFRKEVEGTPGASPPAEPSVRAAFVRLLRHIAAALDDLKLDDLCTPAEREHPTEQLVLRLAKIATDSDTARQRALQAWWAREDDDPDDEDRLTQRSELGNISRATEEALYRRKRAEQASRLLSARRLIQRLLEMPEFMRRYREFLAGEQGQSAVWAALVALKNRHIGTSLLELNVCGAIAPYNALLGGKLAALLALSPQIVADYRDRYGARSSDIASRLKGAPVVRPAELVYLGTSSLYRVGSSQYNRLKLPAGLLRAAAPEVRWRQLGETLGYGTLHISRLTLQCLEEAAGPDGRPSVNHVFGEGASPKLRIIRSAFAAVFDPAQRATTTAMSKHAMGRLIYGAWLAEDGPAYLRGEVKQPRYYFDPEQPPEAGSERIAEYWRERWLLMRLQHVEALEQVAGLDRATLRVSQDLGEVERLTYVPIRDMPALEVTLSMSGSDGDSDRRRDFVRKLYRGSSAYADAMDPTRLADIHVRTSLDDAVREALAAGTSVVLTGNPGDGKTHVLRVLEADLAGLPNRPEIELDASKVPDAELQARWARADAEGRPFCVAINEAVLFNLAKQYPDFAPLQEARRQVTNALLYGDEQEGMPLAPVVVFDLSRRNVLAPDIFTSVLDKLTSDVVVPRCSVCPTEGCDFAKNRSLLRQERVRERLQLLLDRVARRGFHATLRDVQAFTSYLLFANRSCDQLLRTSGESEYALPQLPFTGTGRLFDALRATFDPIRTAHPDWDERLVHHGSRGTAREDWLPGLDETAALDPTNEQRFIARKRAFYFFHAHGGSLLTIAEDDETAFAEFLKLEDRPALRRLLRLINRFFGDAGESEALPVWQSHRYDQSPRQILYSAHRWDRRDFEFVRPRLRSTMAAAFELVEDHVLLRLRRSPRARLRVDFELFQVLAQVERGVPVLTLEVDTTRRLWQFMELLSVPGDAQSDEESRVTLFDPVMADRLVVDIDLEGSVGRYLSVTSQEGHDANRHH